MNIQFECADQINGLMTITIEKADYEEKVKKTLNDYRKKAQVPGFRPGMVPMALIKKQYGTAIKAEEVNRVLGEKLYEYVREQKIRMLGEPLPNEEKQQPQDLEGDGPFEFVFDIAVAPEFKVALNGKDKIDYYTIAGRCLFSNGRWVDERKIPFWGLFRDFRDAADEVAPVGGCALYCDRYSLSVIHCGDYIIFCGVLCRRIVKSTVDFATADCV